MSDMVQVPRATLEYWLANVCDEPVSYVSGMRLDMQRILLEADDLSTEPPNVETSGERVDDVDTFPEDSVNDPDCVEVSPENVITTFHPMPPYVVSMTDNGDGSYHVVWSDATEADMISVTAAPHRGARGMLDLRGSVDPREGMADLHGTTEGDACLFTADQIEAAGFVRKEDMDKAINALRAELMPEIRRAQYPVTSRSARIPLNASITYTVDDGDAE
jgi:hypothetical protein